MSFDMNFDDLPDFEPTKIEVVNSESQEVANRVLEGEVVSEVDILKQQAEQARIIAETTTGAIAEDEAVIAELTAEIKRLQDEAQQKINQLASARNAKNEEIAAQRRAARQAREVAESLARQVQTAELNERIKQDAINESIRFDRLIEGLPYFKNILPHQVDGAKKLAAAKRAILGDKMGLGKTLTSLAFCDLVEAQKILVVVPDGILGNFMREIHHWAPHRTLMNLGKLTKQQRDIVMTYLGKMNEYIVTINYSAWRKDRKLLQDITVLRFDTVILDEAHTIKNTKTSAFKGVEQIIFAENSCPTCRFPIIKVGQGWESYWKCTACTWRSDESNNEAYARCSVRNVLPMTGTPILNKPQDLFAILNLVDRVNFSREYQFLDAYCERDLYNTNRWYFRSGGLASLTKRISGQFVARDRHAAGVVLPPQSIEIHNVEIDPEFYPNQFRVIEQLTKNAEIVLESTQQSMLALATITLILRKRQANVWPAGIVMKDADGNIVMSVGDEVQESAKLDYIYHSNGEGPEGLLADLIGSGMEDGERVALFSQFTGPLEELQRRLEENGVKSVILYGHTPDHIKEQIKMDFDKKYCDVEGYEKKWQVVLCNFKVGGEGINFTDIAHMIIIDEEWNPGKNEQAYGRIDRMGQTEETTVHIIRSPNTIDTWMAELIEAKSQMIEGFNDNMDMAQSLLEAMRSGKVM